MKFLQLKYYDNLKLKVYNPNKWTLALLLFTKNIFNIRRFNISRFVCIFS